MKLLEDMGFSKTGRHWFYTKDIGIEIVGSSAEGRRVNEVLHEGKVIRIISIGAYRDKLDMDYLKSRMKGEDLEMELLNIFKS